MNNTVQTPIQKLSTFLPLGLKQGKFLILLNKAMKEHQVMEAEYIKLARKSLPDEKFLLKEIPGMSKYFQHNFFSILFLSLFISAKIPHERRIKYGIILHSLRTIVTCTDNILDKEQKGSIFLEAHISNTVLNNVMLCLIAQKIICNTVSQIALNTSATEGMESRILENICSVARGEDVVKFESDSSLLEPDEIIDNIHAKIGGQLLQLALVAPLANEIDSHYVLKQFEQGILKIGISLQMLDDCVDIEEDLVENKNNLLLSQAIYNKLDGHYSIDQLKKLSADNNLNNLLKLSRKFIINNAIQIALEGFDILCDGGYPVNRSDTTIIIKTMFNLRGLGDDWKQSNFA